MQSSSNQTRYNFIDPSENPGYLSATNIATADSSAPNIKVRVPGDGNCVFYSFALGLMTLIAQDKYAMTESHYSELLKYLKKEDPKNNLLARQTYYNNGIPTENKRARIAPCKQHIQEFLDALSKNQLNTFQQFKAYIQDHYSYYEILSLAISLGTYFRDMSYSLGVNEYESINNRHMLELESDSLCLMPSDRKIGNQKLYFEKVDGALRYTVIDPRGNIVTDVISEKDLHHQFSDPLAIDEIKLFSRLILAHTAEKGHTEKIAFAELERQDGRDAEFGQANMLAGFFDIQLTGYNRQGRALNASYGHLPQSNAAQQLANTAEAKNDTPEDRLFPEDRNQISLYNTNAPGHWDLLLKPADFAEPPYYLSFTPEHNAIKADMKAVRSPSSNSSRAPAIIIVGGGPIGLAHAWGIKKINPNLRVILLEKHQVYQRKHILRMQHRQLNKLMIATGTESNRDLCDLLRQLQRGEHIRTSDLEQIFKKIATDSGVEIIIEEVQQAEIYQQLLASHTTEPCLIIGADGTHSIINNNLFPEGNQIKHEFDYVLQLRYEIIGDQKARPINSMSFYQDMARQGLVANEYVGHFDGRKTPVTMQMMISKQDFAILKSATSKNPIQPFATDAEPIADLPLNQLPKEIEQFLNRYLTQKIKSCHQNADIIDRNSIRISVNEAPATHAKQIYNVWNKVPVLLTGDAGLGLSYFKGLNAGLESTAQCLTLLAPALKKPNNQAAIDNALHHYQSWFLEEFAPQQIKQVAQYSTWRIRAAMQVMKIAHHTKMLSMHETEPDQAALIKDYFDLLAQDPITGLNHDENWHLYPHRDYDPIKLGQFDRVPMKHTGNKILKLFADYFKPYKSGYQLKQDFKQPLVGTLNIISGLVKIGVGILTIDQGRLGDGMLTLLRGAIEIITTPLAWTIKPILRGMSTLWNGGRTEIEKNNGMKKLAQYGLTHLEQVNLETAPPQKIYELLAVCNDLHRKFDKATNRGQPSSVKMEEHAKFNAVRTHMNNAELKRYFMLFQPRLEAEEVVVDDAALVVSNSR